MRKESLIVGVLLILCSTALQLRESASTSPISSIPTKNLSGVYPFMKASQPGNATDSTWINGLVKSTVSVFAAEFGDKTFFINCILAMTNNIWVVMGAVVVAVLLMNILSCLLGLILPLFLSRRVTLVIAGVLFAVIGLVMMIKGCRDDDDEQEEAEEELKKKHRCRWLYSGVFLQAFALNFFAEWGDTSQITTILLAGNYPVWSSPSVLGA